MSTTTIVCRKIMAIIKQKESQCARSRHVSYANAMQFNSIQTDVRHMWNEME